MLRQLDHRGLQRVLGILATVENRFGISRQPSGGQIEQSPGRGDISLGQLCVQLRDTRRRRTEMIRPGRIRDSEEGIRQGEKVVHSAFRLPRSAIRRLLRSWILSNSASKFPPEIGLISKDSLIRTSAHARNR